MRDDEFESLYGVRIPEVLVRQNSKVPHIHSKKHYEHHPEDIFMPDVMG